MESSGSRLPSGNRLTANGASQWGMVRQPGNLNAEKYSILDFSRLGEGHSLQ